MVLLLERRTARLEAQRLVAQAAEPSPKRRKNTGAYVCVSPWQTGQLRMVNIDDYGLEPELLQRLHEDIRRLFIQISRLASRQQPTASFKGRMISKLGALYDPSPWDTDSQYPWSVSRVHVEGEDAGDSSFARAPFEKFTESLKIFNDAVAARIALEMRRAPLDLTADEIDIFA